MAKKGIKRTIKKKRTGKGAANAQSQTTGIGTDVDALFRKKINSEIQTRYSESLRKWTEAELGVRLPESYISLVKKRNGGRLRMASIKLRRRPKGVNANLKVYTFDCIAGIDKKHYDATTALTKPSRERARKSGV